MGQDVQLSNVGMCFDEFWAVRNVDMHIEAGEFFSFLGPSGCGKTTLLRLISGFLDPSEGVISINGQDMRGIGPNKRHTAMIFQNLALFPLMSVAHNIGFGLEIKRVPKLEREKRVDELLELVDLPGVGDKKVEDLSGGQKQRVAIARALAVEPSVLMLDEPLSALDLKLRHHMRAELRKIQRRTKVTFIYITHDQGEAFTMSDRLAVMSDGKIEQLGYPDAIYNNPATPFVASFVGETNTFHGSLSEIKDSSAIIDTPTGPLHCRNPQNLGQGTDSIAFVRPETISFMNGAQADNSLPCTIDTWSFEGAFITIQLKTGDGKPLTMRISNRGADLNLEPGKDVHVAFSADNALLLPKEASHA
ncbi:MAG: ABC transporter ATP-binding protein [Desulfovibrio sp.]|nr:MAG: ABC transporter ATP-binding protein [Desulfovibrio sp.]